MNKLFIYIFCLFCLASCGSFQDISVSNVESFRVHKMNMKEIEGDIDIKIRNPNSTGFSIYPSEFDIVYNKTKLGKAKLHKRLHINANSEKTYTFKLKTNLENLSFTDVMNIINGGGSGTITLTGDLKAGKFFIKRKYPVNYSNKVNLFNN